MHAEKNSVSDEKNEHASLLIGYLRWSSNKRQKAQYTFSLARSLKTIREKDDDSVSFLGY